MDQTHFVERPLHPQGRPNAHEEQSAFVLSCFRALGSAPAVVRSPDASRDWNNTVKALERHGLLPILGVVAASASATLSVPSSVQQLVLKYKLRMALYHANTLDAMKDVNREMNAAGIPYALLKGTYLYELLYRDLFPREYGDIDLLVPADRIEDAISALRKAGYDSDRKYISGSCMPRWHFHVTLTSKKPGGLPLELHRSLVDKANLYRVRDEDLFARLREFKARGSCFTVLSAEDQFIYLCLHAAKHGILNFVGLHGGYSAEWYCGSAVGNRLIWFMDIELFLRKEKDNLDWAIISERAFEWNVIDDVMNCLRVLQLLQPSSEAEYAMGQLGCRLSTAVSTLKTSTPDTAVKVKQSVRRHGVLDCILRSRAGLLLLERSMQTNSMVFIRPIRVFLLWRSLAPSPSRILGYYGRKKCLWLPWLYIIHPFHMIRKLLMP